MKRVTGFTLIEVMIVIVIIGVLAAVAYPSYSDYVRKSRRADGMNALMALQLAQEKMRANCKFYAQVLSTADACNATAALTTLDFSSSSSEGYYTVAITGGSASSAGYVATATGQGGQGDDEEDGTACNVLTLTVSAAAPQGARTPAACWQ